MGASCKNMHSVLLHVHSMCRLKHLRVMFMNCQGMFFEPSGSEGYTRFVGNGAFKALSRASSYVVCLFVCARSFVNVFCITSTGQSVRLAEHHMMPSELFSILLL